MTFNADAKIPVVVIFAPTATGKTALALNIFGKSSHSFFKGKGELISADSMQVYKKLDIGTAKPDQQEQEELTHHLIDILPYDAQFTVSDFVEKADVLCREIISREHIPVVAGGTGFYIRNFLLGLPKTPESDPAIRQKLIERAQKEGTLVLYHELETIDPQSAQKINPNDEYRILRALEVFYITGKPRSSFEMNLELRDKFDFCTIILERNREELFERINHRVDIMFEQGLQNEVLSLIAEGAGPDMPGMKAIGYREWFEFDYKTQEGLEKIRYNIKRNSRKYAKKQYTFMNDIPGAIRIDADSDNLEQKVIQIIENKFQKHLSAIDLKLNLSNNM